MSWINSLFDIHSPLQAVIVLSLVCALGLGLGKIKIGGMSLGVAFVFFVGILVGNLGLDIDRQMMKYCETFGLVIFVYTLGLHVGPNFFSSLRHEGKALNLWSMAVIGLGTIMAIALTYIMDVPMSEMVGVLCGATTNTPALGAAQQALEHVGQSGATAALATAVTYPLGVVGVIFAMMILRKFFVKEEHLKKNTDDDENHTYIGQFVVVNPALLGRTIAEISQDTRRKFIVSRIWRNEEVILPHGTTKLEKDDNLLVIINKEDVSAMEILFGQEVKKDWNKEQIDWNHIDTNIESRIIVLTKQALNGKHLGQLHLRDGYGVNVSRVLRGDITLLATQDLRLQYGDRLTVVGKPKALDHAQHFLGNSMKTLTEPNLGPIFLGMILGLALGTIPISLPGMESPIRLGIAGGPIVMGILVGTLGPRFRLIAYTTPSASLMLRKLGLALYLACIGLDAGKDFLATVVRPEGLLWIGIGFVLTMLPILITAVIALRLKKLDFATICGVLCGAMANPMALVYANDTTEGETSNITYTTVYPLGMFIRVIIAQILVMFFV